MPTQAAALINLLTALNRKHLCYLMAFPLVLLVSACGDDANQPIDPAVIERHIKQANSYFEQGQFRAASIEASNAIQKAPENPQGHIAYARIVNRLGQHKFAIEQLEQIPADLHDSEGYVQILAEAYLGRSKFQSALDLVDSSAQRGEASDPALDIIRARALFGLGKDTEAMAAYEKVLRAAPDNVEALLLKARLHADLGQSEQTQGLVARAEQQDAENPDLYFLKAQLAFQDADYPTAENMLTEAISYLPIADTMTPRKSVMLGMLAETLNLQGKSAEALIYTQRIAEAFPGLELAEGEYRDAQQLYTEGDLEGAQVKLTKLVEDYPGFEDAAVLLAIINYRQGDIDAATEYFGDIIDPEIANPQVTKLAALSKLRSNQPVRVVELLEDFADQSDDAQILLLYAQAAMAADQFHKVEQPLRRALEISPETVAIHLALGDFNNRKTPADFRQALAHFEKAYQLDNNNLDVATALARQSVALDDVERASNIVQQQLELRDKDIESLKLAGDFYYSREQYSSALDYYTQVLASNAGDFESAIKSGLIHQQQGASELAGQAFAQAATIDPDQPLPYQGILDGATTPAKTRAAEQSILSLAKQTGSDTALAVLASFYAQRGAPEDANRVLTLLREQNPESRFIAPTELDVHVSRANLARGNNDLAGARDHILAALQVEPASSPLLFILTELEIALENYAEAEKLIARQVLVNPAAAVLQGDLLSAQGETGAALDAYRSAWRDNPSDASAERLYTALSASDVEAASVFVREWTQTLPDSVAGLSLWTNQLIAADDIDQAIATMERLRQLAPQAVQNLNNLAYLYQQRGNPAALQVAEQAYRLAPEWAPVVDTYGWILFQQGQREQGISLLRKAAALDPDNETIRKHLSTATQSADGG